MDPQETAQSIARAVATLAALPAAGRRPLLAALYAELRAAGLPEPVAATMQHQIACAAAVVEALAVGPEVRP